MNVSPERLAQLEEERADERNGWRIAEDCGDPKSEADKVWGMVWLEMRFYCPDFMRGLSIAHHARQWIETRNPFYIDAAGYLCDLSGISPPPALAELVADVQLKRLRGDVRAGTGAKIFKEAAKDHALTLMTVLCAAGLTQKAASIKAAAQLMHPQFGGRYKASVLEKDYTKSKNFRRIQAARQEYWTTTEEGAAQLAEWLRIIPQLPDAPDEMIGVPR